jgi:hypothetical protein
MLAAVQDNDLLDDHQLECERRAYNKAFDELGLNWHWDPVTFACLPGTGTDALRNFIEREHPHLLRAYDADFLVSAIEAAKARCHA